MLALWCVYQSACKVASYLLGAIVSVLKALGTRVGAHGARPGEGGLGGLGLGLDVLEDCAPSAALLLLVVHNFLDSEGLLATRGAHLPEAEHYMWAGGKWGCGTTG